MDVAPPLDLPPPDRSAGARLAALRRYRILDTPREADFDDLAAMAAEVCETPAAMVSFLDAGRQWVKAEVGLGLDSLPLDVSACVQTAGGGDLLVVPDLAEDDRFARCPLLTEHGMRFYAGVPLAPANAPAIGTLCVLDRRPRDLSVLQRRTLRHLARQAVIQLELRLALRRQALRARAVARAKARQDLLMLEIAHRDRNLLAVVLALVTGTLRHAPTPEEGRRRVLARLRAVARVNDVLLKGSPNQPARAGLLALARAVAAMHVAPDSGRIAIQGPEVPLRPAAALAMGLALHELAANAVRHGALSVPGGWVTLAWEAEEDGDRRRSLRLHWREEGGPPVVPPGIRGLGTRLIEDNLARTLGGRARTEYPPEGVAFHLEAPLPRAVGEGRELLLPYALQA